MKNNVVLISIIIALVFGAGGFFGGLKYQQSKRVQFTGGQNRQNNRGGLPAGRQGFRPVNGEILSVDTTSITVKLADGSSKIVLLSDKTQINKTAAGAKSDITKGTQVTIFGTQNSDGSVTAQNIQLGLPAQSGITN